MPDPLELPGVLCPVVEHVRAHLAPIGEVVAHRLPGLPSIVGALHDLAVPVRVLGCV